jgi:outer membrane autotransporter protein
MNKAFKIIWSISRKAWVVTGELTRGKSSTQSTAKLSRSIGGIALAVGLSTIVAPTWAAGVSITWVGNEGSWFTDDNWSEGLAPTEFDYALIDKGGTALVSSGTAQAYSIGVYDGTLDITNGGAVSNTLGSIGNNYGIGTGTGSATVDGAGSSWTNSDILRVGRHTEGRLDITNGGAVSNTIGLIGNNLDGTGSVTVDGAGSSWTNSDYLSVGGGGVGRLDITNGGTVSNTVGTIGGSGTGNVTVDGAGSSWTNSDSLNIGLSGRSYNRLTIANNATVNVNSGAGTVTIGSSGILEIGAVTYHEPVAAGTLNAASVVFDGDNGSLYFSHTNADYIFTPTISGTGNVTLESGTTIFTGANTYSGNTTIYGFYGGILKANNTTGSATGTATVTVANGGTLGGSGTISGVVTVNDGGIIAAGNSPSTLTVGSLILNNASILDFELDSPSGTAGVDSDLIAVSDNLTLDGILNITDLGGFDFATTSGDTGSYQLFSYGGTLTDNALSFGSGVLAGYNYTIDTATVGQVYLTADYDGLQFWDGSNISADDTVNGGNGTWNSATTNWAAQSGNVNLAWSNLTAVFSGTAGTVEVDGLQTISGLQFSTDGYQLTDTDSNGELILAAEGTEMRVNPTVIAAIDVALTGTGSLTKTGDGALILTADNSYSGGTTINGGILQLGNGGTTGSVIGNIANNAALSFNRSDYVTYAGTITGAGSIGLISGNTHFTGDLSGHTGTVTVDGGNLAINSNETLSLGGNYTLAAASTLNVTAADDATYSKLVVAGTATLASNAKINIDVTNPNFAFTTAYTNGMADIISAGTLISDGTFAVTDNSYLFNFSAVKDGDTVDLALASAAPAVRISTINQGKAAAIGAATAIDNIISNNPTGGIAVPFVSLTTEQDVANAAESTLPGASGGMAQLTNMATNAVTDAVASRQNATRGLSSGDAFMTDRHVWLKPFGGWTQQDNRQGVTGYDIDSYGLALGVDGDVSSSWNVGAAFAYINSDVESNLAAGSHQIDMDSYLAKAYATKMFDDVTALNLQAGVGLSNYDSNRRLFNSDAANADYDSWNTQLSAELERSYQVSDKTVMTPYVHADYSYVSVESYNESGAGALSLNVDDDSADSLIIGTGVKANHAVSDSLLLMANAGIGYDAMADRSSLTSGFAGTGAQFTTDGIEPDEWVYNAGVGATYSLDNGTEITASYAIDARQDYTDQSVSANFRIMF